MLYEVFHKTDYAYTKPVFIEPLTVQLRPRSDAWQRVVSFQLEVNPEPAGVTSIIGLHGTPGERIWFNDLHVALSIKSRATVETLSCNPFDFVLDTSAASVPASYPQELEFELGPSLKPATPSTEVKGFANEISREAGQKTLAFLTLLAQRIRERCRPIIRVEGDPLPGPVTLSRGEGACRDLAVVFMDACKYVGLASRFVSGYYGAGSPAEERYLHAWAEVYLEGIGWRGYDPTNALAVADRHIVLAAASMPRLAMPIVGTFRATGADSSLKTEITIREADTSASAAGAADR